MAEPDTPTPLDPDALAEHMAQTLLDRWTARRLPVAPLAAAMAVKGLQLASHVEGPEETAAGLERMAAAIREAAGPATP